MRHSHHDNQDAGNCGIVICFWEGHVVVLYDIDVGGHTVRRRGGGGGGGRRWDSSLSKGPEWGCMSGGGHTCRLPTGRG